MSIPKLRAALGYVKLGWRVLALHSIADGRCSCGKEDCPSPAKHPRTQHGAHDATTDQSQIESWWKRWPDANIGIAMGDGIWALDIDVKNDVDGHKTLAELEEHYGPLPATPRQQTPSGGAHILFKLPEGVEIRNRAKLLPGLDTRSRGGYIVASPSIGANGKPYAWLPTARPDKIPLGDAPLWLFERLTGPKHKARSEPHRLTSSSHLEPWQVEYAKAALNRECERIECAVDGHRNNTLNAAAFGVARFFASGALEEFYCRDRLTDSARKVALSDNEISDTIASGFRAGAQNDPNWPKNDDGRLNGAKTIEADSPTAVPAQLEPYHHRRLPRRGGEKPADDRLKLYRWDELGALPEPEPLIDDLLDRAAMSVVYGPSNCGKTFFALDVGARVSLGWPVYGLTSYQGPVIYVAAEPGRGFRRRRDAFDQHFLSHDTAPEPEFAILPASVDLCDAQADTDPIIWHIMEMFPKGVALVVVDTLSRAMAGYNENSSEAMTAFVANCDRIREKTGAHVMIIHHTGKDVAAGSRGHSSLRAATDTEIEITRDGATGISTAKVTKQRDHALPDRELVFRLLPVPLGQDGRGMDITSCVVVQQDAAPKRRRRRKIAARDQNALDALVKAIDQAGETPPASSYIPPGRKAVRITLWRAIADSLMPCTSDNPDSKRRKIDRAQESLQASGVIGVFGEWVWPA